MKNMYARGRQQEYNFINIAKKYRGIKPERVLLSGQRGEGDVFLHLPGIQETKSVEVKARREIPKSLYEWLGKHDLLALKKIGQKYGWLIVLDLDDYLELLSQSLPSPRKLNSAGNKPTREHEDLEEIV